MSGIIHGDSHDVLPTLEAESFDTCITDSPYGLRFTNKHWDYGVPAPELWAEVLRVLKPGAPCISFGGRRTYHRVAASMEDGGFEIVDQMTWIFGGGFPKTKSALKPAHDAIVVARKPGSVVPLVCDVEGNRVGPRWPATLELSCACEGSRHEPECAVALLDEESGELRSNGNAGFVTTRPHGGENTYGRFRGEVVTNFLKYAGAGGASRFFYCSQARKGERTGNPHPTVKPIELVRRLVRLFCPPRGRVIDPFAGSCTTAVACAIEQRECVAIEREAEYCETGRARLAEHTIQPALDFAGAK